MQTHHGGNKANRLALPPLLPAPIPHLRLADQDQQRALPVHVAVAGPLRRRYGAFTAAIAAVAVAAPHVSSQRRRRRSRGSRRLRWCGLAEQALTGAATDGTRRHWLTQLRVAGAPLPPLRRKAPGAFAPLRMQLGRASVEGRRGHGECGGADGRATQRQPRAFAGRRRARSAQICNRSARGSVKFA
eukprot:355715-Chlamydomonas_euryale.AAC.7